MVAEIGSLPVFVAVNKGILPVPAPVRPMSVLLFVHTKIAPEVGLVKLVPETLEPLQTVISDGTTTDGVGLTVIVYDEGVPMQLFTVGVTVIIPEIGAVPVLVALNDGTLPVPPAANPMAALVLDHVYVPPGGLLVNMAPVTSAPLHTVIFAGTVTVGVGFTVTVALLVHPKLFV